MTRISYILILFLGVFVTQASMAQKQKTIIWQGTFELRGEPLRVNIEITNEPEFSGHLRWVDLENLPLPVTGHCDWKTLNFKTNDSKVSFEGHFSEGLKMLNGQLRQEGQSYPLRLYRMDSPTYLIEAWVGQTEEDSFRSVLQFRELRLPYGQQAVYFDDISGDSYDIEASKVRTLDPKGFEDVFLKNEYPFGCGIFDSGHSYLRFEVPDRELTFKGRIERKDKQTIAIGFLYQKDSKTALILKKQGRAFKDLNKWEYRPQRPLVSQAYVSQEVTFENAMDHVTLAGTLTLPFSVGTYPAVILISGAGEQDRDGTVMQHKPFLVLADYLTSLGFAVLRFDDRGTGSSKGKFATATADHFTSDAIAALNYLKNHEQIDAKGIGFLGHGEGGLFATLAAKERQDVAFVVLLATPGTDGRTVSLAKSAAKIRASDTTQDVFEWGMAQQRKYIDIILQAPEGYDFSDDLKRAIVAATPNDPRPDREIYASINLGILDSEIGLLKRPITRFFLSYDPRPALRHLRCPVLALFGSKDLEVIADLNMEATRKALAQGGNQDFEVLTLDGLNHYFQECQTGFVEESYKIKETFNVHALEEIGNWMVEHIPSTR